MKSDYFTPDPSQPGKPERLKRKSNVLTVKIRGSFLLIGLFSILTLMLQGQTCEFTTDKPIGTRGCAPFRVVVKNKCIDVGSFAYAIPYQGNFQFTGDSLVLTFENGAEENPTTFVIGCFDKYGNFFDYREFEYRIDPPNPVWLTSDTVPLGEPVELNRSAGLSFIANFGDGTVQSAYGTISHNYANAGTYNITIPVHSCIDTQRLVVHVMEENVPELALTSLSQDVAKELILSNQHQPVKSVVSKYIVYPNPVEKYCYIKTSESALNGKFFVKIYDNSGRVLVEKQYNENPGKNIQVPLDAASSGLYFLEINDGISISRYPLVKH